MVKYVLVLSLLLAGCANMNRDDKVGIAVVSIVAGAALLVSASKGSDETSEPYCKSVIRPTGGSGGVGFGTNETFCTR